MVWTTGSMLQHEKNWKDIQCEERIFDGSRLYWGYWMVRIRRKKVYEGIWSLQWNVDMLAIFSVSLL